VNSSEAKGRPRQRHRRNFQCLSRTEDHFLDGRCPRGRNILARRIRRRAKSSRDAEGRRHMEYVRDRGSFEDVPFEEMMRVFDESYGIDIHTAPVDSWVLNERRDFLKGRIV
jgi:hypothetical protein